MTPRFGISSSFLALLALLPLLPLAACSSSGRSDGQRSSSSPIALPSAGARDLARSLDRFHGLAPRSHVAPSALVDGWTWTVPNRGARAIVAKVPRVLDTPLHLASGAAYADVSALDVAAVEGESADGAIVFHDARPSMDVVHTATLDGGVEELRILRDARAPSVFSWRIRPSEGLGLRVREGYVELVDARGYVELVASSAFAVDAKGVRRNLAVRVEGDVLVASLDRRGLEYPIAVDPIWTTAPSMSVPRTGEGRAFVPGGKLFVAGGTANSTGTLTNVTELYDPATNTWSSKAPLPTPVNAPSIGVPTTGASAGMVFVVAPSLNERWNPSTNTWAAMSTASAVPSSMGTVNAKMVGFTYNGTTSFVNVYDSAANAWSTATVASGSTVTPRTSELFVPLADGRLFLIGGHALLGPSTLGNTDVYDSTTNVFTNVTATGPTAMYMAHAYLSPTKFIVSGGTTSDYRGRIAVDGSSSIFDASTNTWTTGGPLVTARSGHTMAMMPSGKVIVIGGGTTLLEQYDPTANLFVAAGNAPSASFADPSFLLSSGALVVGGGNPVGIYAPAALGTACTYPYECASGACVDGTCCSASSCPAGAVCNSATKPGVCVKPLGVSCSGAVECETGLCVDGVCCNAACGGQCQACDVPGYRGTCTPVVGAVHGTRTQCPGVGTGDTCAAEYCDGADTTACHFPAAGTTPCGANTCSGGIETHTSTCDGAGKCQDTPNVCGVYVCGPTQCMTSCTKNGDCAAGYYCDAAKSACVPLVGLGSACSASAPCETGLSCTDGVCCGSTACPSGSTCAAPGHEGTCVKNLGSSCTKDVECSSGSCADGVCCDSGCTGQCEACDVAGSIGTCTPITGAPHGTRAACPSDPNNVCAAASCDGTNRASCSAFPASSVQCRAASCQGATSTAPALCDGQGGCPAPVTSSCGGYRCDATTNACKTSCATSDDCDNGFVCAPGAGTAAGTCVKASSTCSPDGLSVVEATGVTTSCAPYLCVGNTCATSCTSSDQCAAPNLCDGASSTCIPPPAADTGSGAAASGGCAIRGGDDASPTTLAWLLGLATAAAARRRRARR